MNLTLAEVFAHPQLCTYQLELPSAGKALYRPLEAGDLDQLTIFLEELSPATRTFSIFSSYDRAGAQELCDAINRYDKLRFVVELLPSRQIIGLFEYSFDLHYGDLQRYTIYGLPLDENTDCRFGPTLSDAYQDQGIGSLVFPYIVDIAKQFGKKRIILWGGVFGDNKRAIRYYEKLGFRHAGRFADDHGRQVLDMILDL